jgi:hypothetical protein
MIQEYEKKMKELEQERNRDKSNCHNIKLLLDKLNALKNQIIQTKKNQEAAAAAAAASL